MERRNCPYEEAFREECTGMKRLYQRGEYQIIYHYLKPEDAPDKFEQFLWCDKVGGKVYWAGRCSDAYPDIPKQINPFKQKKRNKRERDRKYKKHLKFLAEIVPGYPSPAIYTDEIWIKGQGYVENPKPYYKRLYRGRGKGMSYYHKKMSNRKIRRYKGELPKKGNSGHRLYDFWWGLT